MCFFLNKVCLLISALDWTLLKIDLTLFNNAVNQMDLISSDPCPSKQPFADVLQNRFCKNFTIFTEKHLCWSQTCNFIKMRLINMCFPLNVTKCLRTIYFTEHLRWLLWILNLYLIITWKTEDIQTTENQYFLVYDFAYNKDFTILHKNKVDIKNY